MTGRAPPPPDSRRKGWAGWARAAAFGSLRVPMEVARPRCPPLPASGGDGVASSQVWTEA